MLKREEIADPNSCWNKASDYERVFILLERDLTSPETIEFWIAQRIKELKNSRGDEQLRTAKREADRMRDVQRERGQR